MLTKVTDAVTIVSKQDWILEKLGFNEMYDREHSIEDVYEKTFLWLLLDDSSIGVPDSSDKTGATQHKAPITRLSEDAARRKVSLAFRNWLDSGDGTFLISGEAGSGKSTLMKFFANDGVTKTVLKLGQARRRWYSADSSFGTQAL
ncbi:hypothetical protein NUW58_g1167 [Xylaria curta]|uniref:Uncharacterized protein n=1 Tax=Xylaria curta TaxID=42375 RepID=A0ACC1PPC9_9PEZI|nr:hypothetical protein NUW58_g1167 [Xylaria curta]